MTIVESNVPDLINYWMCFKISEKPNVNIFSNIFP